MLSSSTNSGKSQSFRRVPLSWLACGNRGGGGGCGVSRRTPGCGTGSGCGGHRRWDTGCGGRSRFGNCGRIFSGNEGSCHPMNHDIVDTFNNIRKRRS